MASSAEPTARPRPIPLPMSEPPTRQPSQQDPLHGITLKTIVTQLVEKYGWEELGQLIKINCFTSDPSISSSLKFLRKTPWARQKVEDLYLRDKG